MLVLSWAKYCISTKYNVMYERTYISGKRATKIPAHLNKCILM